MIEKKLGKISKVRFGSGGYQDCMFGLSLTFDFKDGSGCFDFIAGGWLTHPNADKENEPSKLIDMGKMGYKICNLLRQAKVSELNDLEGTPIEATFSSMRLVEWRILEEVL